MDPPGLRVGSLLTFLAGCATEDYDVADLQVDVRAAVDKNAETARICVEGVGFREEGAGNGRLAFPGLPSDVKSSLVVDILDSDGLLLGRTVPVEVGLHQPYQLTTYGALEGEPCAPEGELAGAEAESLLLVVRFVQSGWEQN